MKKLLLFVSILFTAAKMEAQVNLSQGLVAYYPFNNNFLDQSGNGHNPSISSGLFVADRNGVAGGAIQMNANNFIAIPNSPDLNMSNGLSLCVYIKVNGFYRGTCHGNAILNKGNDNSSPGIYGLRFDDRFFTGGQNCNPNSTLDTTKQTYYALNGADAGRGGNFVSRGVWTSVVSTYDGISAKMYVNCQLVDSVYMPGLSFNNAEPLVIGKTNSVTYPYNLTADLDEIRIYNRALTAQEVSVYGGCTTITTCDDVCNWKLLGNSNVTAQNFIGSTNNEDLRIRTNNTQKMVITVGGNIGIGTNNPTKTLQVQGEARITNLPPRTISDRVVFADSLGNLHAEVITNRESIEQRLQALESEVARTKLLLESIQTSVHVIQAEIGNTDNAALAQNIPNPITNFTSIAYNIPGTFTQAKIVFYNANGQIIKTIPITVAGNGAVQLNANNLAAGIYAYTLFVDGRLITSKQMIKN